MRTALRIWPAAGILTTCWAEGAAAAGAASDGPSSLLVILGALVCAAALAWAARERVKFGELRDAVLRRVTAGNPPTKNPPLGVPGVLDELDAALDMLRKESEQQTGLRARADEALRGSEERYALAVRGASDGLWEWNYRTRQAYFSSRAKVMLGYAEDEIGNDVREWRARIHPADLKAALNELKAHEEGRSSRFELEHRMLHKDGTWRWVLARATIVRHANGKPERMVGLYTDITARKCMEQLLLDLAEGLSGVQGDACFRALTRSFAQTLGVREAFICECSDFPTSSVRMLAYWKDQDFAPCVEFDLAGTACEEVIGTGQTLYVPCNVGERWPLERDYEREGYLGLPCVDSQGEVIGHIACAHGASMPAELPQQAILKIFAIRASIELERRRLDRERRALGMRNASSHVALH